MSDTRIHYRKAKISDSSFVRDLRNNPDDRKFYRKKDYINPEDHARFWGLHWKDYYIIEIDGNISGFLGFVSNDFRIAISEEYRGKGYGKKVIEDWLKEFKQKLVYVHKMNKKSLRIFEANGFRHVSDDGVFACLKRD